MAVSRRALTALAATTATALAVTAAMVTTSASAAPTGTHPAEVRVNQVGYATDAAKVAFVMLPKAQGTVTFTVASGGSTVYRGSSSRDLGSWNSNYGAVYQLGFTSLSVPGTYRIHASGAVSPAFQIADPATLYSHLVSNGVAYFTSERDGADVVPAVMNRQPANLTDEQAYLYADPSYDSNDNLLGSFRKIGGPVDVSGGWFDAGGGYEKFAYTSSYTDGVMLMAARDYAGEASTLAPEAQYGLEWIAKLWNPVLKVLYAQVGIGNGNAGNTIQGDYNFWFLPQSEDQMNVTKGGNPGPTAYFVKYRPVFEAAAPGKPVSPDLAGRFAADFALGAQLKAAHDPVQAAEMLALARGVYADAKTGGAGQLVTTFPHDYYPGTLWRDDMAWGAAEIALADEATGAAAPQTQADLAVAARWMHAYIAAGHQDTLNLYDNGALAEAELLQAMQNAGGTPVIAPSVLLADMAAQLRYGEAQAHGDPFGLGTSLGQGDASPHAFGLYITDALYRKYGGNGAFDGFAQQQLDFALGANPWGASFVVGAGSGYPRCMQSEIANLTPGQLQVGATTDGPSGIANFSGLGTAPGMKACSAGNYAAFNSKTTGYEDNVVSWPSVEPALDYCVASLYAFALGAASLG
jgi:endoglucanase